MAQGIPTSNILQPGSVSITGGANRALVSLLQLLTPQYWNKYVEKYGREDFTWWLATFGGMEEVKNRDYFWFENRGKLMEGITNLNTVTTPAAGATVNLTLSPGDHFASGTESPLRVGETLRVASSNVEGVILDITPTTGAFTFHVAPKQTTQAFAGNTGSLVAGEVLLFGGLMDVGEASSAFEPLIHLDQKYQNSITEMREDWSATDLAEMTEVFYDNGVTGDSPAAQAGTSYFTYKGLVKANVRFKNYVESKLMRGDIQNNTAINATSVGSQGIIPYLTQNAEMVGYSGGIIDFAKLHEITRVMDINGCAEQAMWLMDIFQRQQFSDGIFKELPAGAFVWGTGEKSQEATMAYGFESVYIDGYMLKVKKYKPFNSEYTTGKTPTVDYFRNYGLICPNGETIDARDASKVYKNIQIMYQAPPAGGTIGNAIRVWQEGGGSRNPTDGTMRDRVHFITYRGSRVSAANQFIQVVNA